MCLHVWSDYIRLCEHRPTDQTLAEFVNVGRSELEVSDVTSSKVSKNLLSGLSCLKPKDERCSSLFNTHLGQGEM